MADPSILGSLAGTYLVGMIFFGMIFTFTELAARVRPQERVLMILGLFVLNLMMGGLIFLGIGVWGAAYKTTEMQKRKKK